MHDATINVTLDTEERERLHRLVDDVGETKALAIMNVGREALARALAGLGVRRGTLAAIRAGLATIQRSPSSAA